MTKIVSAVIICGTFILPGPHASAYMCNELKSTSSILADSTLISPGAILGIVKSLRTDIVDDKVAVNVVISEAFGEQFKAGDEAEIYVDKDDTYLVETNDPVFFVVSRVSDHYEILKCSRSGPLGKRNILDVTQLREMLKRSQ